MGSFLFFSKIFRLIIIHSKSNFLLLFKNFIDKSLIFILTIIIKKINIISNESFNLPFNKLLSIYNYFLRHQVDTINQLIINNYQF